MKKLIKFKSVFSCFAILFSLSLCSCKNDNDFYFKDLTNGEYKVLLKKAKEENGFFGIYKLHYYLGKYDNNNDGNYAYVYSIKKIFLFGAITDDNVYEFDIEGYVVTTSYTKPTVYYLGKTYDFLEAYEANILNLDNIKIMSEITTNDHSSIFYKNKSSIFA